MKPETRERMWTRQKTRDGKETEYGLGWGVLERKGEPMLAHGGSQAGTRTQIVLLPQRGVAIALLSNLEGVSFRDMIEEILQILDEAKPSS